jgi:hypothetical protein
MTFYVYDRDFNLQSTHRSVDHIVEAVKDLSDTYPIDRDRLLDAIDSKKILIPNELIVTTEPLKPGWVPLGMKSIYVAHIGEDCFIRYPSWEALQLAYPKDDWERRLRRGLYLKWHTRVNDRSVYLASRPKGQVALANVYDRRTCRLLNTIPVDKVPGQTRSRITKGILREDKIYVHQGTHRNEEGFPKPIYLIKDLRGNIIDHAFFKWYVHEEYGIPGRIWKKCIKVLENNETEDTLEIPDHNIIIEKMR